MRIIRTGLTLFFLLVFISNSFSAGKRDFTQIESETLDSWSEEVDLTGKKTGKYNIYVTAEDLGHNVSIAGPYNIVIDPDSDLPVSMITNPVEEMRVQGNLNIVGICVDDDAVGSVMVQIDEEEPVLAQGTDFWSFYLDTTQMEEGKHTIKVYGIDINGVQGIADEVVWHLDRRLPETRLKSHEEGVLVSGKVKFSAEVFDGNGIETVLYSIDGEESYSEVSIKYNKQEDLYNFSFPVDTRKLDDGPHVCWIKALDKQGSIGFYTFLFFVDNTPPLVEITSPVLEESVNGIFTVTGSAYDEIGLKSLSWKMGGETGSIEIIKGNPWWSKTFDYRNFSGKSADFQIIAEDTVGNIVTVKQKINIDNVADKPVLTINSPVQNENIFSSFVYCSGSVTDDDDPGEIHWSLDGGETQILPTNGVFDFKIESLSPGSHTLNITPYDVNGVSGDSKQVSFVYAGENPSCTFKTVSYMEAGERKTLPYYPGIEIHPEKNGSIYVEISTGGKFISGSYTYGNSSPVNINLSGSGFEIPVPKDTAYGAVPVTVDLEDNFGRKISSRGMVYITNLSKTRNLGNFESLKKEVDVFLSDAGLSDSVFKEVPESPDGKRKAYTVEASAAFGDLLSGGSFIPEMEIILPAGNGLKDDGIKVNIETNTPVSNVFYSFDETLSKKAGLKKISETSFEAQIPLSSVMDSEITKLLVKVELKTGDFLGLGSVFSVLRAPPAAGVNDESDFVWVDPVPVDGRIITGPGTPVYGFFLPETDKALSSVDFKNGRSGGSDYTLTMEGNGIVLTFNKEGVFDPGIIVAADNSGKIWEGERVSFVSDSFPPEIDIVSPAASLWVKDSFSLAGSVSDSTEIVSVQYSLDNKASWTDFAGTPGKGFYSFETNLDISGLPDGLVQIFVKAVDSTGKESVRGVVVHKDTVPPEPVILVPAPESVINGENTMVLRLEDAGIIQSGEFRAPGADGKLGDWIPFDTTTYTQIQIGTPEYPVSEKMEIRLRDFAGNETLVNEWPFKVDAQADLPVTEIHIPSENEVVRNDFVVSGVVYDDDGVSKVWYKIDDSPYLELESSTGFSIPIPLSSLTDNEHTISVYGEDIYGVKGEPVVRTFRVSLEEPKAAVNTPSFDETKQGIVDITGVASDKNGISRVQISLDNGNTFNDALGQENWIYSFDSNILQDGTHVVFVKVWDNYETQAMYSSLINIDNTAPEIYVNLPVDATKTSGNLFLSGNVYDNINLQNVYVRIRSLSDSRTAIPPSLARIDLEKNIIMNKAVDISSLPDGYYNIEFVAEDSAGNVARASRNITLDKTPVEEKIVQLYPLNGEHVNGFFNIYGRVFSKGSIDNVSVIVDGEMLGSAEITESGYFRYQVNPEILGSGEHSIILQGTDETGKTLKSDENYLIYSAPGPWVTIDNLIMGDFAAERPWIEGLAGYVLTESDVIALRDKKTPRLEKKALAEKAVDYVDVSFDNGKTFVRAEAGKKWRYRLETQDMAPGLHFMIVRAVMRNGEQAVTKTIVQIDKTPPVIKLLSPMEGDLFNSSLEFSGLSSDDIALKSVTMSLRSGDKASYEVPGFIQGLYFDTHFWGASLYDVGIGLTFFDDNVKLQVQYGQFTEEQRRIFVQDSPRYGGHVIGAKLLANVATVPFSYFFGPDWDWLSGAVTLGANFSVFTQTQRGVPQMLSAVVAQLEFPRVTFENRKMFRTVSFYTEGQLWFIPSDVSGGSQKEKTMLPHISCGLRLNLF